MFMVLSSWPKSLWEFTRFIWWMQLQTERRVAANLQLSSTSSREMFQFDLPSAILKKRAEKFDSALLNWLIIS